ncbi:MAG: Rpn family recombination-promoting nuclease/putative transposase [Bacteroidales bacterium]|nr:Rpn family recombination-promoting nuclease/putative transposase [Bacteroidales bacterium]
MEQIYANLTYDEAFKLVIFAPGNEPLIIKMLELILPGKKINSLVLKDREQHGLAISDKNSTFDIYCTGDDGESFIVEMQHSQQTSFMDRMLCYSTFPIREQLEQKVQKRREAAKRGDTSDKMDYSLMPVYVVSFLNFTLPHESEDALEEGLLSRYCLRCDGNGEPMTGALKFVYLELERLKWGKDKAMKCTTLLEQFAWSLKYMHTVDKVPENFEDEFIRKLYERSAFANMSVADQHKYEEIMRTEIDILAQKAWARAEGRAEGLAEGRNDIARRLRDIKVPVEQISQATGLSIEQIAAL